MWEVFHRSLYFLFCIVYSARGEGSIFLLSWTGERVLGIAEGYLHIYQFSLEKRLFYLSHARDTFM